MWILILTITMVYNTNVATSISTVPVTFIDLNTCIDAGKQWAIEVKSPTTLTTAPIQAKYVCVKHFANSER